MSDLFSTAQVFLTGSTPKNSPERTKLVKELEITLKNAPFLSVGEKSKMAKVISLFSDEILLDLKQTLIRQSLRYLNTKTTTK